MSASSFRGVTLACVACVAVAAEGATVPSLRYRTTGGVEGRRLIFVNNPEEIRAEPGLCDLADDLWIGETECAKVIHRLEGMSGSFRDWWEHTNKTKANIVYGVRVTNTSGGAVEVRVRGQGLVTNGIRDGGREFVDLFRGVGAKSFSVPAKGSAMVFQSGPLIPQRFFAGVVDFDVSGGSVTIENLAWQQAPAAWVRDEGYDTRVLGAVHESLVYKGLSAHSEAVADGLDFVVDDRDEPQRLRVAYRQYRMPSQSNPPTTEGYCVEGATPPCFGDVGTYEGQESISDSWITHIAPDPADANPKRFRAVVADMVTFHMPGFPWGCRPGSRTAAQDCFEISPFFKWFYPDFNDWKYPNWGNWAVHYKLKGSVENRGTVTRQIHLGLRADGNSPIAFRGQGGVWRHFPLVKADANNPEDYFPYSDFLVHPGQRVPFLGELVLSGPATGTLENLVKLVK